MFYFFLEAVFVSILLVSNTVYGEDDQHNHSSRISDHQGEESHEGDQHGEHDNEGHEEHNEKFGKGKAIEAVRDEGRSFKLSSRSMELLKLSFHAVPDSTGNNEFRIPRSVVANHQELHTVYVRGHGEDAAWFTAISVSVLRRDGAFLRVKAADLKPGQRMVSSGLEFLRIAQLEASGKGGQGHAH